MKKIPLVLSGLVLTASGANLTTAVLATNSNQTNNSTGVISYTIDSGIAEMALTTSNGYIRADHTTFNHYEHYRQILIQNIGINRNSMTIRFDDAFEGWKPLQAVIVYRDYENGVTEAEADEKFKELTNEKNDWSVELLNKEMTTAAMSWSTTLNRDHQLKDNLTDIVYYAVKYGRETTDADGNKQLTDTYWLRGKVDYRKCGHSKVFNQDTMTCFARLDSDNKVVNYLPHDREGNFLTLPENEVIRPWEDELATVLSEKANKVREELNVLLSNLIRVKTIMSDAEVDITKLNKAAPSSSDADSLLIQAYSLEELLKRTQGIYNGIAASGDIVCPTESEVKRLEQELAEIEAELRAAEARITAAETRATTAESKQADAEAKLQTAEEKLAENRQKLQESEQKRIEAENQTQEAQQKMLEAKEKLAEIEAECQNLQKKIEAMTGKMDRLKQENAGLKQANAELKKINADLKQENEGLGRQKLAFEEKNQNLTAENHDLQAKNQDLEAKTAKLEAKIAEMEQEKGKNEESGDNASPEASGGSLDSSENGGAVIQPDDSKGAENGSNLSQEAEKSASEAGNGSGTVVSANEGGESASNRGEEENISGKVRVNDAPDGENTGINKSASEKMGQPEVEVPNLGGTETKINFWWVLIGVVGLFGASVMWLRKALISKIKR